MQLVDLAVDDQRVSGIVTALEPRDDMGAFAQPVYDLALTFVAPLRADDHDICHVLAPSFCRTPRAYTGRGFPAKPKNLTCGNLRVDGDKAVLALTEAGL